MDTPYGNYRDFDNDIDALEFEDVFRHEEYVNAVLDDVVKDLFGECFKECEDPEQYWDEFRDFCRSCL